jgi:hypothetical protein
LLYFFQTNKINTRTLYQLSMSQQHSQDTYSSLLPLREIIVYHQHGIRLLSHSIITSLTSDGLLITQYNISEWSKNTKINTRTYTLFFNTMTLESAFQMANICKDQYTQYSEIHGSWVIKTAKSLLDKKHESYSTS